MKWKSVRRSDRELKRQLEPDWSANWYYLDMAFADKCIKANSQTSEYSRTRRNANDDTREGRGRGRGRDCVIFVRISRGPHTRSLRQLTRPGAFSHESTRDTRVNPWSTYAWMRARTQHACTHVRTSVETDASRAYREGWRQRDTYGTISRLRKRFCQLYVVAEAHGRIARALQSASVPPNHPIPTTPDRSSSRSHHGTIVCSAVHAVCHHSRRWRRMPSEFHHEARGFSIEVSGGGGLGGKDERDGVRAFAGGAGAVEAAEERRAVAVVQILGGRYDAVVSRNCRTRPTILTTASSTQGAARDAHTHSLIRSMKLVRIVPAR
jgi:hypothetical protein